MSTEMAAARMAVNVTAAHTPAATAGAIGQHSPWHSPVPYLFGGLAAMLGLIAFALLILACSYWKLSGYLENGDGGGGGERDLEAGGGGGGNETGDGGMPSFAEKILVIMAGEKKPTFLATQMSSKSSSFGDTCSSSSSSDKSCSCGEKSERLENGTIGVEMMMQEQNENMGSN